MMEEKSSSEIAGDETDRNGESKAKKRKYEEGDAGRCSKQASKRNYSRKRRFKGNQFTSSSGSGDGTGSKKSKSKSKKIPAALKKVKHIRKLSNKKMMEGFRIIDITILSNLISCFACPDCKQCSLLLDESHDKRRGLASHLVVYCNSCNFEYETFTSKNIYSGTGSGRGSKPLEVNYRAVYACRTIGAGYSSLEKLCGLMNIPHPMTVKHFDRISSVLGNSAQVIAESSTSAAAQEINRGKLRLRHRSTNRTTDVGVSVDGCWQKRGYVSLNGTVAVISMESGKILDVEVLSRYCKICQHKQETLEPYEFREWYDTHQESCRANHDGTSPMMEVEGAVRIFQRSIEKHSLRYMEYYGDGDSKAYSAVKNTYSPDVTEKKECVGHYQKRVGCRIRKAKKEKKGLRGLPDWMVDKLQNYFGIALRANTGTSAKQMGDAIWASFLHVASSETRNLHSLCQKSASSCCQYQRDQINGTNLFKPGPGLSDDVILLVKPIYTDLIKPEALKKCLHGLTQNHNESFNSMIWERAPKNTYISLEKMKFAVYDAVGCFNDELFKCYCLFKIIHCVIYVYCILIKHLSNG